MPTEQPTRDGLAAEYFEQIEFEPYPLQEEALLAWFTSDTGVLVCAPTGTGKTLIAEAALFEALHTGRRVYYTTPLIALTDQKFHEFQQSALRWGFHPDDIGLVTGNRRVNPDAKVLVVVAEILLNRLLTPSFEFDDVAAVVMDEFHNFNDPERGIVWEFTLGLLPEHIRLLLLSATVGNSLEFVNWMSHQHKRRLELVQGEQRHVPLTYQWVEDAFLSEHLEQMAAGDEEARTTPALVFCFNREQCWTVAEQIKGKRLLADGQQEQLVRELKRYDLSQGAGPKLKQILMRGIGVHHAGVLPKYRRIVEELFQRKLLSVTVCTETLAAGVNLPARSVVLPGLLKGPPDKKKVLEPSAAHQMFGRAGRPQFDTRGFVFALAHEDDVKILRWRKKFDQIPEGTKDPGLLKARKALKKKMPKRRTGEQYWTERQFDKLKDAAPGRLQSRGAIPWRLLAYMLQASPEVEPLRTVVGKRLMNDRHIETGQKTLERMLMTLWTAGYVDLEPPPPKQTDEASEEAPEEASAKATATASANKFGEDSEVPEDKPPPYKPILAHPTPSMDKLQLLRGMNPLYGVFLVNQLGIADRAERLQAMESVLEIPGALRRLVRVPPHEELPPGPLATTRLDVKLLQMGLATAEELGASEQEEEESDRDRYRMFAEDRVFVLTLAEKLRRLFDYDFPGVHDVRTQSVWVAGEILEFGGDFNTYVTSKRLQKQEGIIFRHLLRLILLIHELRPLCPPDTTEDEWNDDLQDVADRLTDCCRKVDSSSTDKALADTQRPTDASKSGN